MGLPTTLKLREADKLTFELGAHDSLDAAATLSERLLDRLRALDFSCFEAMGAEDAVPHMLSGPMNEVVRAMNEAVRLLRSLPRLAGGQAPGFDLEYSDILVDLELMGEHIPTEGRPKPPRDKYSQGLDSLLKPQGRSQPTAADLEKFSAACDHMVEELKSALDFIRQARRERSKWALITAGEEARRKTQKSVRAGVILGMRLVSPGQAERLFPNDTSELESALRVRAALMSFRQDIGTLVATGARMQGVELGLHLRDVRIRMLQLFSDRSYSQLRAPDRFELQRLFGRMSAWLDHPWEQFEEALKNLDELGRFVDTLVAVNGRDVLVEHDREVRNRCLGRLQAMVQAAAAPIETWRTFADVLADLLAMQWRSAELDAHVLTEVDRGAGDAASLPERVAALAAAVQDLTF